MRNKISNCKYGFYTCSFIGQDDFCNTCDGGQNYQMKQETKLIKAKSCDGCRASEERNECSIDYQCTDWIPLEKCPKPKTIRQLIDAGKKIINEN